ncbi:hypothetical protein ACH5RR_029302 [Cinchona calisaya]|uniref:Uncharacterized protein n=1 Tax=Cinchona calisaya TaxID=153742 RepID=A0ABD2YR96_9GENT
MSSMELATPASDRISSNLSQGGCNFVVTKTHEVKSGKKKVEKTIRKPRYAFQTISQWSRTFVEDDGERGCSQRVAAYSDPLVAFFLLHLVRRIPLRPGEEDTSTVVFVALPLRELKKARRIPVNHSRECRKRDTSFKSDKESSTYSSLMTFFSSCGIYHDDHTIELNGEAGVVNFPSAPSHFAQLKIPNAW